jgi:hypothetical protein
MRNCNPSAGAVAAPFANFIVSPPAPHRAERGARPVNSLLAFAYPPTTLGASFADMQTVVFGM